jgi:hypothetical protein
VHEALGGTPHSRSVLRDKKREITHLQAELEKKQQIIAKVVEENLAVKGGSKGWRR